MMRVCVGLVFGRSGDRGDEWRGHVITKLVCLLVGYESSGKLVIESKASYVFVGVTELRVSIGSGMMHITQDRCLYEAVNIPVLQDQAWL